jgi:hypothetical protein
MNCGNRKIFRFIVRKRLIPNSEGTENRKPFRFWCCYAGSLEYPPQQWNAPEDIVAGQECECRPQQRSK